ncbi:TAXI family TRAP transporter solute-binding subunit [Streptomyces albipurpureus]|uniref:TAXI family TRAP transporter solute-binding subunit n=1 Tax=Streptomyces albipurpureus TaxID=2897419 RepID=A0ABT0UJ08_9ACTN|nr:TAXI family TRAP transporter solute-binding subunit [Streptomyces sp. CWNU-1]MCM2388425.1 TAXI family TRAP transporter solute-binding subunit [Streptomyces sp. CWNU-1]
MFQAMSRINTRALQAATAALVLLGLMLWWLLPLGESSPQGSITFSTGLQNGVYQRYGVLLKEALDRDLPQVDIELQLSEGSQQNLQRVAAGDADFTIATADAVAKYIRDGRPGFERLRGCARLYDDYVQLVVPKFSEFNEIEDLRGKKVGIGPDGSGVRLIADRLLAASDIDPAKDITPVHAGIDTVPNLLKQGKLDAFFWSGGLPTRAVQNLSEQFPIRLLPLHAGLVDRVHSVSDATSYYRLAVMPPDAYLAAQAGVQVSTMAVPNLLVTTDRIDPELVEGFTRTVIKSRDRIGNTVHPAQLVDLRTAIYTDPLPLHEGATRYYGSVKP